MPIAGNDLPMSRSRSYLTPRSWELESKAFGLAKFQNQYVVVNLTHRTSLDRIFRQMRANKLDSEVIWKCWSNGIRYQGSTKSCSNIYTWPIFWRSSAPVESSRPWNLREVTSACRPLQIGVMSAATWSWKLISHVHGIMLYARERFIIVALT